MAVELSLERLKLGLDGGEGGLSLYILSLDFLQCDLKAVDSDAWVINCAGGCGCPVVVSIELRRTAVPWWPSWKIFAQPWSWAQS